MSQIQRAKSELFPDRRSEEHLGRALKHVTNGVGILGNGGLLGIFSLQSDPAAGGFEKSQRVFDQGGFARTIMPQNGDDIACVDGEVNIMQHFRKVFLVTEMNVLKIDQGFRALLRQAGVEYRGRFFPSTLHDDLRREFDLGVIHFIQ